MQVEDHHILVGDSLIFYTIAGDSTCQPLVFLHGAPWGMKCRDVTAELAKYFYVIALEQPGFGRSDPLARYTNLPEQYADVVHQILEKERLGEAKSIIMAQSFGGHAAHGYLKKYPDAIRALVLVDAIMPTIPIPRTLRIFFVQIVLVQIAGLLLPILPRRLTLRIVGTLWKHYEIVWDAMEKYPRRMYLLASARVRQAVQSFITGRSFMEVDYSRRPVLMLWGERDGEEHTIAEGGGVTHIRVARLLYEKIKKVRSDAQFVTLKGGHTVLYDEPAYVVGEMLNALTKAKLL
ncbi:alpha/beta hydrolase [Candidatus Kaiserbacteria bacterium]|nr:alpha/beta hydrolase [Candidatus Kaiserbacteria bacterium]